jgi:hypothetical protein
MSLLIQEISYTENHATVSHGLGFSPIVKFKKIESPETPYSSLKFAKAFFEKQA